MARAQFIVAPLLYTAVSAFSLDAQPNAVLRVGGPMQTTGPGSAGRQVFEHWKTWVAENQDKVSFTVELDFRDNLAGGVDISDEIVAELTGEACAPICVDVLVCPYTSGLSTKTIQSVFEGSAIPIMVWGGAADSIFDTECLNKKCFGTFTTAAKYFDAGLKGLNAGISNMKVGIVSNDKTFSLSLADGIKAIISAEAGMTLGSEADISSDNVLSDNDKAKIKAVLADQPDVVTIAGHSGGNVESVVLTIAEESFRPVAIMGTNILSNPAAFELAGKTGFRECLMMPSQWARSATDTDSIVGWTSASFEQMMGVDTSYQAASAAAAAIALTHALIGENPDFNAISTNLATVDTNSFYGPIKFASSGAIDGKPMYVYQQSGDIKQVVFPEDQVQAELPLGSCSAWDGNSGAMPALSLMTSLAALVAFWSQL